jgi:uncharacterized membrane protein YbhN (UPF0104 family)
MRILIALLTILFVLMLVALTLLNLHERAAFSFWFGPDEPPDVPLSWILWGGTLSGVAFTGLIAVLEGLHLRLANGRLRRQVNHLQEELDDLRSLPLREAGPPPQAAAPPPDGAHGTAGV